MEKQYNKFGARLIEDFSEYELLSLEYNIPISEILQIDMNRCGVFLPKQEVRENFRVRFTGQILDDYNTWYALPVRSSLDTNFSVVDGFIYFQDMKIGLLTGELMLDTCESSYQRGPNLLNLNSRSRSNCGGCRACIHNYKDFYDHTVIKDQNAIYTREDMNRFFDEKRIDVANLAQIAVVTGLFHGEENVIEHMGMIHEVAKERGFDGELMYFGCEINSEEALDQLAQLDHFALIYAYDNFTKRKELLTKTKSVLTLEKAKQTLLAAKKRGIQTTISYIDGIDFLERLKDGFEFLNDSLTQFPIINIYQIQNDSQASILEPSASEMQYYLDSRQAIETIFSDRDFKPKRWTNYRPLWYKYYNGEKLENNAFGQLEKVKRRETYGSFSEAK